jgi:hypothetical protein
MPPFGPDEKIQAIHVLSVVAAARALVAAVSRNGGSAKVSADALRDELKALCNETNRLGVYEARAAARGTAKELSDERLADAVEHLRRSITLTADDEELLDLSDEQIADAFGVDDLTDADPRPAPAPVSDDADVFSLDDKGS